MHIVALLSRMLSAVLRAIVVLVSGKTQTESPSIYLLVQCVTSLGGGGDSNMEQTGMLVGNFEFNPKGDHLGVAQAFCNL